MVPGLTKLHPHRSVGGGRTVRPALSCMCMRACVRACARVGVGVPLLFCPSLLSPPCGVYRMDRLRGALSLSNPPPHTRQDCPSSVTSHVGKMWTSSKSVSDVLIGQRSLCDTISLFQGLSVEMTTVPAENHCYPLRLKRPLPELSVTVCVCGGGGYY